MNLLIFDVLNNSIQLRHADTEGAIFHLPTKEPLLREGFMHPFGGATLDKLQRLGNRKGRGQREQDVDMVRHAPNLDGLHVIVPGDAAQKGPESFPQFRGDQRLPLLGAENAMVIRADIRHGLIQPSLRDLGDAKYSVPRLKRWASVSLSRRDRATREIPKAASLWLLFCPTPLLEFRGGAVLTG